MVATYLILLHYNSIEWVVLPFIFRVRKFLQLPVQVAMGFLTRPVTADQTHDDAWRHQYGHDDQCGLHIKYICYWCSA